MEPMEPMVPMEGPTPNAEAPPRRRSRARAALAGLAVAAMLTSWGAASVFAASPDPSASGSPAASDDAGNGGSGSSDNADHNCPNDDSTGSDSGTDATSS